MREASSHFPIHRSWGRMSIMNMNRKMIQLVSGLAGILAILCLDVTFAAAEELRVEYYEDHRLTVAARAVEAKKLLEAVTDRSGVYLDLIEYPAVPPVLTLSFEQIELDQAIQRILDVLGHQTPISYVLLYGRGDRGGLGLEKVVLAFGEGGKLPAVAVAAPRPEQPTPTRSARTPQPLPPDIERKLPEPVKERLGQWQKGWGAIRSLIEERRQKAGVATK